MSTYDTLRRKLAQSFCALNHQLLRYCDKMPVLKNTLKLWTKGSWCGLFFAVTINVTNKRMWFHSRQMQFKTITTSKQKLSPWSQKCRLLKIHKIFDNLSLLLPEMWKFFLVKFWTSNVWMGFLVTYNCLWSPKSELQNVWWCIHLIFSITERYFATKWSDRSTVHVCLYLYPWR